MHACVVIVVNGETCIQSLVVFSFFKALEEAQDLDLGRLHLIRHVLVDVRKRVCVEH